MLLAATCGYGLVDSANADTITAQTVTAPVEADGIRCDKVLLNRDRDKGMLHADFLVQQLPEYNGYRGVITGFQDLNSSNTDLRLTSSQLASWLIVIDVSDPGARKKAIADSAAITARLISLMSGQCKVSVLVVAGSMKKVMDERELSSIMTEGANNDEPIYESGNKGSRLYSNPVYHELVSRICSTDGIQLNNTHLWISLSSALKNDMPDTSSGIYRFLPRGVILISDGVDESASESQVKSSEEDFHNLVNRAKEMGVPIHTIGFRHKDKGGGDDMKMHRGFAPLARLADQTGGVHLTYERFGAKIKGTPVVPNPNSASTIALLDDMLRHTSAMMLHMETPMVADGKVMPAGRSLKLELTQGQKKQVAYLEIPQESLGLIVGDYALEKLYDLRCNATKENLSKTQDEMIKIFKEQLLPLSETDKLFENTYVDRDFARRVKQVLLHVKNSAGIWEKEDIEKEIVFCIIEPNRNLPEPPKPETNVNVENNTTSHNNISAGGATSGDGYAGEDTPSLVWWVVGIGGAFACIIVFIIIVRTMNRDDDDDEPVAPRGMPSAPQAPAPAPAPIATLDDAKQPGQSWAVRKTSVTVGRSASADVRLPSGHVSNIHFTLYRESNGQWMVKDANSTNGTIVNGSTISAATPVNPGDIISVADMQLVFRLK